MSKPLLCKLGIHKWDRATFLDSGIQSNVRDYKQKCKRCDKRITWVQPKGTNVKFYPQAWAKRRSWLFWLIIIIIIIIAIRMVFF